MTVVLRADAADEIGTGHMMRCMGLAMRLEQLGERPVFVSRRNFPNLVERIQVAGWRHVALPEVPGDNSDRAPFVPHAGWLNAPWQADADATAATAHAENAEWIVVDHYGLDVAWEEAVRRHGFNLAALDDLADRTHAADLIVDPSLNPEPHARYGKLVSPSAQKLFGPRYAILRPEFSETERTPQVPGGPRCLIAFGGVDTAAMTLRAMNAVASARARLFETRVIVGGQNQRLAEIRERARQLGWPVHVDSDHMAAHMAHADFAIGAGGHMLWERCAMALPSVVAIVAPNQIEQVQVAAKAGACVALDAETMSDEDFIRAIERLANQPDIRAEMGQNARAAVDGLGGLRIARRLAELNITAREAVDTDLAPMLHWRNDERIRRYSRSASAIPAETHATWFAQVLADPARRLLIVEDSQGELGVVRFDQEGATAEVSIYMTPERLGSGLGANLLLAGEEWLRANVPTVRSILAEVLDGNAPSEELFLSCGYVRTSGSFKKVFDR